VIDLQSPSLEEDLQEFGNIFNALTSSNTLASDNKTGVVAPVTKFVETKYRGITSRAGHQMQKPNLDPKEIRDVRSVTSLFKGFNLWLLKPSDYNRGQGIQLFADLATLRKEINEQLSMMLNAQPVHDPLAKLTSHRDPSTISNSKLYSLRKSSELARQVQPVRSTKVY
jgi:hypothetical protein